MSDEPKLTSEKTHLPATTDLPEDDDAAEESGAPRAKRTRGKTLFVTITSVFLTLMIVGSISVIGLVYYFGQDLPDFHKLSNYHPAGTTRLFADDGSLMAEYAVQKRFYMPLDKIPRKVINAFVAAEDQNYYQHTGVDPMGILRAALVNMRRFSGEDVSLVGGSTITQQVVKNFLLTNEKSFSRKIKEALLAFRITRTYSKDKILELYLNEIYLGMGSYGVVASAQTYFNKSLHELSTEEIALLAAMPKAPANYDPRYRYAAAMKRRGYVLARMAEDGYINREEERRAASTPIELADKKKEMVDAGYFSEEVRRWLMKKYGADQLYKGGLYVKTTLDSRLQKTADTALRNALLQYDQRHGYRGPVAHWDGTADWAEKLKTLKEKTPVFDKQRLGVVLTVADKSAEIGFDNGKRGTIPFTGMQWAQRVTNGKYGSLPRAPKDVVEEGDVVLVTPQTPEKKDGNYRLIQIPAVNGAVVVLDPRSGKVLAMSGGYDPKGSEFNRATQAKRQPGSSFKPFVYLAALERGFTPASIVLDEPVELYQGPGLPMWRPKNYESEYLGPTTLRIGLEKSRNLMTVRLAQMLGIKRIVQVSERFGIYKKPPANYSMVLGSAETTLLKLVNAYGMIANGGLRIKPALIERVDDHTGTTIYRRDKRVCEGCQELPDITFDATMPPDVPDTRERMTDPRITYQTISLLEGVIKRGTGAAAAKLGRPLGGKTGTTNDSRDAWFIGFSPDLVTGIYIGFDTPKSLGGKETGGRVALPAFIEVMGEYFKDAPKRDFAVPPGIQFAQVNRFSGVPPIPGEEQTASVITETFITGGPVFIPENEIEVATPGEAPADGIFAPVDGSYQPMQYGADGQLIQYGADGRPVMATDSTVPPGYQPIQQPQTEYPSDRYRNRIYRHNLPRQAPANASGQPASVGTGALY